MGWNNITKKVGDHFISHLKNGGTLSLVVDKYKNISDKKNNIIQDKFIQNIRGLKRLGFRNKKAKVYRYKISSTRTKVEKIAKRDVLFMRPGGKSKFSDKFDTAQEKIGLYEDKVDTVIDGFFGGGGYTLHNIEKLSFKNYIINDIDTFIPNTMLAIKLDFQRVICEFNKINDAYQKLIPGNIRNYKSNIPKRQDKNLKLLREKNIHIKAYCQGIVKKMDNASAYDIYTIAAHYIFMISKTTNGFMKYRANGIINNNSFNHNYSAGQNKIKMIKHWSYLLNKYDVEILNKDIFELLKTQEKVDNSLVFLDPPYINCSYKYSSDNSDNFQLKLLKQTKEYKYRIYCNEDCQALYTLGIDKHFSYIDRFDRNNKLGNASKNDGGKEFLGCSVNTTQKKTKPILDHYNTPRKTNKIF